MIAVQDIAYVRYAAPDLDLMEGFLKDFGLVTTARTPDRLYMRGYGDLPFVHVTERGEPASMGIGFLARSADDLAALARSRGVPVERNPEPGGGQRVRLRDPAGFAVDVVHGYSPAAPLAHRAPVDSNRAGRPARMGGTVRVGAGPAHAERLGHVVLRCPDFAASLAFYRDVPGFRPSDSYYDGTPDNLVVTFLHCGLGDQWTDHHTIAIGRAHDGQARFGHSAFEVTDLDDLAQGNAHLKARGYRHSWGIGRHIQGSQVFDYWRDPFSNQLEHWTDGDLVNDGSPVGLRPAGPNELFQWGPDVPADFFAPGPALAASRPEKTDEQ